MNLPTDYGHRSTCLDHDFFCGIGVIDEQHRKLLNSVSVLQDQVRNNASRSTLSLLLSEFLKDLDLHFKTEEALIEIIDSEDARTHLAEHAIYLRHVEQTYGMLMMRSEFSWNDFLVNQESVLKQHIRERDVPLYREIRKRLRQVPQTPTSIQ